MKLPRMVLNPIVDVSNVSTIKDGEILPATWTEWLAVCMTHGFEKNNIKCYNNSMEGFYTLAYVSFL